MNFNIGLLLLLGAVFLANARRQHKKAKDDALGEYMTMLSAKNKAKGSLASALSSGLRYMSRYKECRAVDFNQTIAIPGCTKAVIPNRFCIGQCTSVSLPIIDEGFEHASIGCKPDVTSVMQIIMECERNGKKKIAYHDEEIVHTCACSV